MNTAHPLLPAALQSVLRLTPWAGGLALGWFSFGSGLQMGGPLIAVVLAINGAVMGGLLVEAALSRLVRLGPRR